MSNTAEYTELQVTTNFSFLQGASHPEEYIQRSAELGYRAAAITDLHSLAGIVRGHLAAKRNKMAYITGARLELSSLKFLKQDCFLAILVYPTDLASYQKLCKLLTLGKRRTDKDNCLLTLEDFLEYQRSFVSIIIPPAFSIRNTISQELDKDDFLKACQLLLDNCKNRDLLSMAITKNYENPDPQTIYSTIDTAEYFNIRLVATNNVYYHTPDRRPLQDLLTCIRNNCTIQQAGLLLFQNTERHLKSPAEMQKLFRDLPKAIKRTLEITEMTSGFSLDHLSYEYPDNLHPEKISSIEYLTKLTWFGAKKRYSSGIPEKVKRLISQELSIIKELGYEKYFLTCYDIVRFARSKKILCQGRGSAANSAVCFCLGITAVNPAKIDLLFARFISKERNEPPDIDIDFEHERREEVIQYIYQKYGRQHAALTAAVITYRGRSAVRDTGKALGLSLQVVDKLAKSVHHWTNSKVDPDDINALGLNIQDRTIQNTITLSNELRGFPRHLSQHVGGFIISDKPLSSIVPIRNASMEERTIIEWDKDDIDALGILKIDILALGMLTCLRKAFEFINRRRKQENLSTLNLASIPAEDPKVYDMICASDTIGLFQIESRAQMSMLPRLKPRGFYDLVIEVAIVRPGPIQGKMVHPYLKRRNGLEKITYPDKRVEEILGKTMGVPIFQEQAMRLAIVLAGFDAGEAEMLRRTMAAWRRNKEAIEIFRDRIMKGMLKNGYSDEFAESCLNQIKGFSEYGFPESHAASFALLVYASAWQKKYYPAEYAAALINSQPMGFYQPAQIMTNVANHNVEVKPIDINFSSWDCTLEKTSAQKHPYALRPGLRLVKGLSKKQALLITTALKQHGKISSILILWQLTRGQNMAISKTTLFALARADAFNSIGLNRRSAFWQIRGLPHLPLPLDKFVVEDPSPKLPATTKQEAMFQDFAATGFSLKSHPLSFVRSELTKRSVLTAKILKGYKNKRYKPVVSTAGMVLFRQRPGTAKGVVFITLEDETGMTNLIIRPTLFEKYYKLILSSSAILAKGRLESIGSVVYINVQYMESIDNLLL